MGKLTWGIVILAAGTITLAAVILLRSPGAVRQPTPPPATKALSDSCCLAEERASRGSFMAPEPPKAPQAATASGLVKGKLSLPWQERKKLSYAYAIYAFTSEGKLEGPYNFANTDQFELAGLVPGRTAILFYPLLEDLSFPYQVVDVLSSGPVEISLRPTVPYLLSGRVVDANGRGVGGVLVVARETMQLPGELYVQGRPAEAAVVEKLSEPVVNPASPPSPEIASTYVRIDPLAGTLSRGVTTDAKGHFGLPVSSPTDPVPITIRRGKSDVLIEETVLPGSGPVRILVPNQ
ncbi:MAG TPA: hypothetical protein VG457_16990 [Planctomycetota bacterium]|nr:hypothetical protein [Planctomycetota bacterium]